METLFNKLEQVKTTIQSTKANIKGVLLPPIVVGINTYKVRRLLSEAGRFGEIFLCMDEVKERLVAIKSINIHSEDERQNAEREFTIWATVSGHPNIVDLFESSITPQKALAVMTFCDGGSLLDYLNAKQSELSEFEIFTCFHDACCAVQHLHSMSPPVIHRDIKIENLLHSTNGPWKLCDFGSCTTRIMNPSNPRERAFIEDDISRNTTLSYRAPEMVDFYSHVQSIGPKADVWALGCLLYKITYGCDAFENALGITNCRYFFPRVFRSKELKDLISSIFIANVPDRPDVNQVLLSLARISGIHVRSQPNSVPIETPVESEQISNESNFFDGDENVVNPFHVDSFYFAKNEMSDQFFETKKDSNDVFSFDDFSTEQPQSAKEKQQQSIDLFSLIDSQPSSTQEKPQSAKENQNSNAVDLLFQLSQQSEQYSKEKQTSNSEDLFSLFDTHTSLSSSVSAPIDNKSNKLDIDALYSQPNTPQPSNPLIASQNNRNQQQMRYLQFQQQQRFGAYKANPHLKQTSPNSPQTQQSVDSLLFGGSDKPMFNNKVSISNNTTQTQTPSEKKKADDPFASLLQ